MLDFAALELGPKPNQYLVCPADFCPRAEAHRAAPVYDVPVSVLRDAFLKMAGEQKRTTLLERDDAALKYEFVQRTAILRFPDYVSVEFIATGAEQSSLAIYSRSQYGYSDLGVNKKRINGWLDLLAAELSAR